MLTRGDYLDPYTGTEIAYVQGDGNLIDIDHVVALGNAWATGAVGWPIEKRAAFANDPLICSPPTPAQTGRRVTAMQPPGCHPTSRSDVPTWPGRSRSRSSTPCTSPTRRRLPCSGSSTLSQEDLPIDTWQAPTRVDHRLDGPEEEIPDPGRIGLVRELRCRSGRRRGTGTTRRSRLWISPRWGRRRHRLRIADPASGLSPARTRSGVLVLTQTWGRLSLLLEN